MHHPVPACPRIISSEYTFLKPIAHPLQSAGLRFSLSLSHCGASEFWAWWTKEGGGEAADRSVPFNPHPNGTIHSPDPISICNKICHNRLIKKNKEAEELIKGSLEVKQAAIQKYYTAKLLAELSLHLPFSKSWDCKLTECFSSPSPWIPPLLLWQAKRESSVCLWIFAELQFHLSIQLQGLEQRDAAAALKKGEKNP